VPKYQNIHFDTEDEFNSYISADDYGTGNNKGICVALSATNTTKSDWHMNIHMNDHRIGVSKFSYA
jgi:hypothetical protein